MDAYWRHHHHRSARTRNTTEPLDPDENRYHKPWPDPPSIEEPLAKFILSTMVLLLRMTTYEVSNSVASVAGYTGPPAGTFMTKGQTNHPSLGRSLIRQLHAGLEGEDIGFRYRQPQDLQTNGSVSTSGANADFGSSLAGSGAASRPGHRRNASLESTAIGVVGIPRVSSLLFEIARMVGRIVYFLSSSSWPVIFARIRNRILYLSSAPEEHPDAIELRLLDWCSVNQAKLTAIFRGQSTRPCPSAFQSLIF
jgi:neurofibromin 1